MSDSKSTDQIELIPREQWQAYRVHQQRLKWAKLGELMGERMHQQRISGAQMAVGSMPPVSAFRER